jgi:hypothetical protein
MKNKVLSYHNDANLKKSIIAEMKKHQEQDNLIKGTYGVYERGDFKACAIGCAIKSVNKVLSKDYDTKSHEALSESLGIPLWLSKVQDSFFECLPNEYCGQFAIDFLESIPVGVDLEPLRWNLCTSLLKEGIEIIEEKGYISNPYKKEAVDSLRNCLFLYECAINDNGWNYTVSNEQIKKMERLSLKAHVHLPKNIGHIINMAVKSIKIDEDSMHKMFISSTLGSGGEKPSTEHIENAYIGHSHQLLHLLKNAA